MKSTTAILATAMFVGDCATVSPLLAGAANVVQAHPSYPGKEIIKWSRCVLINFCFCMCNVTDHTTRRQNVIGCNNFVS